MTGEANKQPIRRSVRGRTLRSRIRHELGLETQKT